MKLSRLQKTFFVLILLYSFSACLEDVSRDNPLDPVNGNQNLQLSGQVLTFYHPRNPIPQASVLIQPGNIVIISDHEGLFSFNNLVSGSYSLVCQADGYQVDSATINIQTSSDYTFLLDGLPQFEQTLIKAHHRSRWFPWKKFILLN